MTVIGTFLWSIDWFNIVDPKLLIECNRLDHAILKVHYNQKDVERLKAQAQKGFVF